MRVVQKQISPMQIIDNLYSGYGWDHYNARSCWGKWVTHSVRFRVKDPGLFRFPVIHIWRSYQLCVESKLA